MPRSDDSVHPITGPAQDVANESERVRIAPRAIVYMAAEIAADTEESGADWLQAAPPTVKTYLSSLSRSERIAFFTIFHSAGFSYWGEPRWQVEQDGTRYDGAMAWLICLSKDKAWLSSSFLKNLSEEKWQSLVQGCEGVTIPLSAQRLLLLQQLAPKLDQFKALIENKATITSAKDSDTGAVNSGASGATSALGLAFHIAANLPGFNDCSHYRGLKLPFLKRAQLLASDLNEVFAAENNPLVDLDQLTAFADYKIPQLLREKEILVYDEELARTIDNKEEIAPGSQAEIEIRANTIIVVEKLRLELLRARLEYDARTIDAKLWRAAQKLDKAMAKPYHRCRTINY
ncbi:MAG: hypothetical protein KGS72_05570 [Cyanobacteria bacterium REEB67]|nr:hypothetical protein [Cyanobacteria bacterium REEB67]